MFEVEARLRLAEIITKQKAQKKGNNKRGEVTKEEQDHIIKVVKDFFN